MASRFKVFGALTMAALVAGTTLATTAPASAWIRHGYGGYHGGYGHRGLGGAAAGAAIGLGIGALAGAALANGNSYYNGYPVYNGGVRPVPAYGYDYYPSYGYYGPY